MQCQGDAQSSDAAAGNENGQTIPGRCLWSSCHFAGRQHAACLEGTHKDTAALWMVRGGASDILQAECEIGD